MKDPNAQPVNATEDDIIRHIDDKLFIGQKNHFQVYQAFDNDQDGYVSNNDIRNTVLKKNWMEEPDIEKFVEYVDPENKGFVDFRQFSTKIRRNMTNLDEDCKFKNRNIMQPAKEHVLKRRSELERMSQTFTSLKNAYRPDPISSRPSSQTEITGKTRYGNTPGIKNTFLNFQHCENSSPM